MNYLTSIVMNETYKIKGTSFFFFDPWFGKVKDCSDNTKDFFALIKEEKFLKFLIVTFYHLRNISDPRIQNTNVALNTTYIETEIKK